MKHSAPSSKSNSSYDPITFLQQTIGNHAVYGLFKAGTLQPKLKISQPNDIYEQEADRVAEQVMRMPETSVHEPLSAPGRDVQDKDSSILDDSYGHNPSAEKSNDLQVTQVSQQLSVNRQSSSTIAINQPTDADILVAGKYGDNILRGVGDSVLGTYPSNVRIVDEATAFCAWWSTYGGFPETDNIPPAWIDMESTPTARVVWVRKERVDASTFIHEALHYYGHINARAEYNNSIYEGMTEYFTREITRPLGIPGSHYIHEFAAIYNLVMVVGDDIMRGAYFEGNTGGKHIYLWGTMPQREMFSSQANRLERGERKPGEARSHHN
jgi:hypothetical protein